MPPLMPGIVQLWHASAREICESAFSEQLASLLSPKEHEHSKRFHFEANRREYIVGRGLVRLVLSNHLKVSPEEQIFSAGPFGKPELASPLAAPRVHFNV